MEIDIRDLEKPSLFDKFKVQTYKDYELSGVLEYLPIMKSHHFHDLKHEFHQSILKLELSHALKNLLYPIDLTELKIKKSFVNSLEMHLKSCIKRILFKLT